MKPIFASAIFFMLIGQSTLPCVHEKTSLKKALRDSIHILLADKKFYFRIFAIFSALRETNRLSFF